jgi:hypothetical protein
MSRMTHRMSRLENLLESPPGETVRPLAPFCSRQSARASRACNSNHKPCRFSSNKSATHIATQPTSTNNTTQKKQFQRKTQQDAARDGDFAKVVAMVTKNPACVALAAIRLQNVCKLRETLFAQ